MSDDRNLFTKMSEDYQAVTSSGAGETYSKLSTTLEKMDASLREYAQDLTLSEMKAIVKKLKKNGAIASSELKQMKLWIVGDAEYYTKMENNFDDWKNELQRLITAINDSWAEQPNVEQVLMLRGLVRDAIRTIADLFYFVQQKDRIAKFNDSTEEIDALEREFLVRLLEQKIKSPHY